MVRAFAEVEGGVPVLLPHWCISNRKRARGIYFASSSANASEYNHGSENKTNKEIGSEKTDDNGSPLAESAIAW
jgi:hypothetical protein